ncbi:hypothetical protein FHS21_005527 [Phyllobacterium trifolii]|jgi:hypothetical protein|uniref:Uncharacterized protein n=1 Tax=Phyllobacterium trifolii TaxID=300193 RepID=A0A839UDD5_9HYPH|nr:hypothetical protein [Phyllobacterium trifolii]
MRFDAVVILPRLSVRWGPCKALHGFVVIDL